MVPCPKDFTGSEVLTHFDLTACRYTFKSGGLGVDDKVMPSPSMPPPKVPPPRNMPNSAVPTRPTIPHDHPTARLDRATLLSHALWSLAAERLGLSDTDLAKRMEELDLADGLRDQRVQVLPKRCPCGAMVASNPGWCISCGKRDHFGPFESV